MYEKWVESKLQCRTLKGPFLSPTYFQTVLFLSKKRVNTKYSKLGNLTEGRISGALGTPIFRIKKIWRKEKKKKNCEKKLENLEIQDKPFDYNGSIVNLFSSARSTDTTEMKEMVNLQSKNRSELCLMTFRCLHFEGKLVACGCRSTLQEKS